MVIVADVIMRLDLDVHDSIDHEEGQRLPANARDDQRASYGVLSQDAQVFGVDHQHDSRYEEGQAGEDDGRNPPIGCQSPNLASQRFAVANGFSQTVEQVVQVAASARLGNDCRYEELDIDARYAVGQVR